MFGKKEAKLREEISEFKRELAELKSMLKSSIGNKGVLTDSQQAIDRQSANIVGTTKPEQNKGNQDLATTTPVPVNLANSNLDAAGIIRIVSGFKEDLQKKFKSLTEQQFFIFSIIYSLEEQLGAVSYKDIALKSRLTESAVRDYARILANKGIPIIKEKSNNKKVLLKIAPELRSIVSLDALMQLRNPFLLKSSIHSSEQEQVLSIK